MAAPSRAPFYGPTRAQTSPPLSSRPTTRSQVFPPRQLRQPVRLRLRLRVQPHHTPRHRLRSSNTAFHATQKRPLFGGLFCALLKRNRVAKTNRNSVEKNVEEI